YTDHRYTENTRVSYPIEFIPNALIPGIAGHPKVVIFLTADAFGVMPPVAKLTTEKAIYNFILGYTSKLAGTERGIVEPQATFSVCFGAPFMPLNPKTYAQMLGKKITQYGSRVYLVNTGWIGGPYGVGKRIDIDYTRKMVKAAIDGTIDVNGYHEDPIFQFSIPNALPGIPNDILNPGNLWSNHSDYSNEATKLRNRFDEVMKKYLPL
ncbi:MAG: phosphoenolpyruvate carboxykinase (ATP), partial [Candidatus Atribacteria bacterium]|nr:phosphoenolpyruvate carboxykinase (ATP) [Candidatus Atribacteria bacterium]